MPGVRSLQEQQYRAFSQNAFRPIMGELFGAGPELNYHLNAMGGSLLPLPNGDLYITGGFGPARISKNAESE